MKLIRNIFTALVAVSLVAGLASCSEKEADYSPTAAVANDEVYFAEPEIVVEASETESVGYVDILRVKNQDDITVPLKVTSSNPETVPAATVSFKQGENAARIAVNYNPENIEPGKFDTLTIAINSEDYVTPYGSSSVTVLFGKSQTWTSLGDGQFLDIFWDEENYYDVEIQQCDQDPDMYRVVEPYKEMIGGKGDKYFVFKIYDEYTIEDQTITDFVLYEPCNCGYYHSTYGNYIYDYSPYYFTSLRTYANLKNNCVAGYKDNGEPGYITMSAYYYIPGVGGWNYSSSPSIEIIMPGYDMTDYSANIDYVGKLIHTDDAVSAVANITLGSDVNFAKIGLAPGEYSQEACDSIAENGTQIDGSGEYKFAMPEGAETGKYTIYVITYNKDADAISYGYNTFKYVAGEVQEETWTPLYVGTWTYTLYAFCNEDGSPYDDEGLILYKSDQDPTRWKIEPLWYNIGFVFTWDSENNVISFEDQFTGANYGYGDIYAVDMANFEGYDPGYYDQSTGTFKFDIYYVDDQYSWGHGFEDFKLTGNAESAARAIRKAAAIKKHSAKSIEKAVPVKVAGLIKKSSVGVKPVKFQTTIK